MAAMTYLKRHPKTGTYYFRRAVPDDIRHVIGKREFKVTLGTKDVGEAKRKAHEVALDVERKIEQARLRGTGEDFQLSKADAEEIAARTLGRWLQEDAEDRITRTTCGSATLFSGWRACTGKRGHMWKLLGCAARRRGSVPGQHGRASVRRT